MNRRLILPALAAVLFSLPLAAKTPKWYKSQKNSVVQIISYDSEGNESARGKGFFISKDGTGVTGLDIFNNAYSAKTIDGNGIERPVQVILGADGMYEVVRFQVTPDKKICAASLSEQKQDEQTSVSILPFQTARYDQTATASVSKSMVIDDSHFYYNLSLPSDTTLSGCPVFNQEGKVIGMIQNGQPSDTVSYAIDARFIADIRILTMSLDDKVYSNIHLRKSLPQDADQALAYIYLKQNDLGSKEYGKLLEDFLIQFPNNPDGLFNLGSYLVLETDSTQYERARQLLERSIELSDEKGRMHCDYANLIYTFHSQGLKASGFRSLDEALDEINIAISLDTVPMFYQVKGNIEFALKQYPQALESYMKLNATNQASTDSYLMAYTACSRIEGMTDKCIELLDTAIMMLRKPFPPRSGTLFLERANLLEEAGRYREAVRDYYLYEDLVGSSSLNANFYYARYKLEIQARMYEQALNDILETRKLVPQDQTMTLEHASLLLRIGNPKAALPILQDLVGSFPEDTDILRLTGVCYLQLDQKQKGIPYLQKAKDLGDSTAEQLLKNQ